jgi:hypothetical protein
MDTTLTTLKSEKWREAEKKGEARGGGKTRRFVAHHFRNGGASKNGTASKSGG